MKKLMFILAAVVATVTAQAASVSWTCTNVKDGDGNAINGIAYFVNAATLSQSDAAAFTTASEWTTALSGMYSWTPETAGKYSNPDGVANATLGLSDATASEAYLVIFDTATITDDSHYYMTSVNSFDTYAGTMTQNVKWGSQSTASQASGAWSAVMCSAVPVPTSVRLMLIGLAGLALRRGRRA